VLEKAADLRGVAVIGDAGASDGDALLARLDFLGNLYLENCTIFREGPIPVTANKARRVVLDPPAYYPRQAVDPGAGRLSRVTTL
jgi:hypothetical protein